MHMAHSSHPSQPADDPITTRHGVCNLCEAICGLSFQVQGTGSQARIISVRGNEADPLSRGHICPKAVALKDLHEDPQVPNYWDPKEMNARHFKNPRLQAGMVLAIEPMVNAGTEEVLILEDAWTVITLDRALSAHFEHMVLITDGEPEILTARARSFEPSSI